MAGNLTVRINEHRVAAAPRLLMVSFHKMNTIHDIGIIILAAGASTRLGSPKQLVEYEGKTLIERISQTAVSTGSPTSVVLGANSEKIISLIKDLDLVIVVNEEWEHGMSSSIACGLKDLKIRVPDLSAAVILLCDQPFVNKEIIQDLVKTHAQTGKNIIASSYGETIGTPALFARKMFGELSQLSGDRGAKGLINKYRNTDLALVSVPEAQFDIDTADDVARLNETVNS